MAPGGCPDPPVSAFELGYPSTRAENGPRAHRRVTVAECADAVSTGVFLKGAYFLHRCPAVHGVFCQFFSFNFVLYH